MLKLAIIPDPKCSGKCRYRVDRSVTTAMFYTPIYDKLGNNVNKDKNITMSTITCITCNRAWLTKEQYAEVDITEISNGNV